MTNLIGMTNLNIYVGRGGTIYFDTKYVFLLLFLQFNVFFFYKPSTQRYTHIFLKVNKNTISQNVNKITPSPKKGASRIKN